jgi:hypothetical protein
MGYSSRKYGKQAEERPWKVHPVWRGIGCFMAIIMPVMAWAGADLFLKTNTFVPLPPELYKQVLIPLSKQGTIDSVSSAINSFLIDMGVTWGMIFFTFVFLFLGYGVLSILYSIMYRVVGPPRYSQFDARPMPAPKKRRF